MQAHRYCVLFELKESRRRFVELEEDAIAVNEVAGAFDNLNYGSLLTPVRTGTCDHDMLADFKLWLSRFGVFAHGQEWTRNEMQLWALFGQQGSESRAQRQATNQQIT